MASCEVIFDLDFKQKRTTELEKEMSLPEFWSDTQKANKQISELKLLRGITRPWRDWQEEYKNLAELAELVEEEDKESIDQLKEELEKLKIRLAEIEFRSLLSGQHDDKSAILSIHAGAGGTESCDWAEMLLRMYTRWAENRGFKTEMIDTLVGEEAGIRSATVIIRGDYAYGLLKAEEGVHRLVRISPFDANRRRHTSFASVDVIPEIENEIKIEINEADLKIDTFRAGGPGGQHVNVTDSAVRITHLPTGLLVQCQNERSQHKNKATALKVLKARLYEYERKKKEEERLKEHRVKGEIAWGSQIRSYVMHPYSLVKDHRTDYQTSNVNAVMDGKIEGFIEAYLKLKAAKR